MKSLGSIENALRGNGNIINENRRLGRSLSQADRSIILRNRKAAADAGYRISSIMAIEFEGERGRRGAAGRAVIAKFHGIQESEFPFRPFRFYNIKGDHPQNNSTVTMTTLVREGIWPTDISIVRALFEYANEFAYTLYCSASIRWSDTKALAARIGAKITALSLPGSKSNSGGK